MANDETLAALERAANMMERPLELSSTRQAAALIRALIERERAGGERAQIVAYMKGPAIDEAKRKCEAADEGSNKRRDFAVVAVAVEMLADAIAAGAHLAGPRVLSAARVGNTVIVNGK